jgi:hypothetical protein
MAQLFLLDRYHQLVETHLQQFEPRLKQLEAQVRSEIASLQIMDYSVEEQVDHINGWIEDLLRDDPVYSGATTVIEEIMFVVGYACSLLALTPQALVFNYDSMDVG